jgi:predicted nucleic acid-binding protein
LIAVDTSVVVAAFASWHEGLVEQVAAAGLASGAIYDALIAATASRAEATLLSRDRCAAATYEVLGVYELVA